MPIAWHHKTCRRCVRRDNTSKHLSGISISKAWNIITHPLTKAQNSMTHPIGRAENMVTHPPSAPAHPPCTFWPVPKGAQYVTLFGIFSRTLMVSSHQLNPKNKFESRWSPEKRFLGLFSQLFKLRFTAMVTYSFHLYSRSSHHFILCFTPSFHGLMNSINWSASSVWVFIAQLGEHCSANAEATDSNPVEAPKNVFSGYFRNCLNCDSLRWSHTHFICIPGVHIISFCEK